MGRPVKKNKFGTGTDKLQFSAWVPGAGSAQNSTVIRQTGRRKFIVTNGTQTGVVTLQATTPIAAGQATCLVSPGGSGASLTPRMKVLSATIAVAGSGYTNGVQTFTVNTGTGTQATVSINVVGGVPTGAVTVLTGGSYSVIPTLAGSATTGPVGSNLTLNLVIGVESVTIGSGGTGYQLAPSLGFGGAGGSGTTATATVVNGVITAITITAPGTGYTAIATCTATATTEFARQIQQYVVKTFTNKRWKWIVTGSPTTGQATIQNV